MVFTNLCSKFRKFPRNRFWSVFILCSNINKDQCTLKKCFHKIIHSFNKKSCNLKKHQPQVNHSFNTWTLSQERRKDRESLSIYYKKEKNLHDYTILKVSFQYIYNKHLISKTWLIWKLKLNPLFLVDKNQKKKSANASI